MSRLSSRRASERIVSALLSPMRVFMAVTGHKPDRSVTPVQAFELAQRARAQENLRQLARAQEGQCVIEAAEAHVQKLDDEITGRIPRAGTVTRH